MQHGTAKLVLGILLIGVGLAPAGAAAQGLTADEIVTRMMAHDRERQAALDGYGSERTYRMEYHGPVGERRAEMVVRMEFSEPDRKRFTVLSESGSTIFCNQVLRRLMEGEQEGALEPNHQRAMLSPANDRLTLVGTERVDGVDAWVLDVSPRVENRFNYRGRVWVSKQDFAVVRIVGSPARNPTWLMGSTRFDYRYGRSGAGEGGGAFWLPIRSVTVSHLRIGGEITLTVDYGTYRIAVRAGGTPTEATNAGLSRQTVETRP
jgi:hypothetical protein